MDVETERCMRKRTYREWFDYFIIDLYDSDLDNELKQVTRCQVV